MEVDNIISYHDVLRAENWEAYISSLAFDVSRNQRVSVLLCRLRFCRGFLSFAWPFPGL
jgi:hypothetical protein